MHGRFGKIKCFGTNKGPVGRHFQQGCHIFFHCRKMIEGSQQSGSIFIHWSLISGNRISCLNDPAILHDHDGLGPGQHFCGIMRNQHTSDPKLITYRSDHFIDDFVVVQIKIGEGLIKQKQFGFATSNLASAMR